MENLLGLTVKDSITKLEGIAIGYVQYLTGCNQYLVQPESKNNDYKESFWIDEQRLKAISGDRIVLYNNVKHPGSEKQPPKR